MRAYIESYDEDDCSILIELKSGKDHLLINKAQLDQPLKWIFLEYDEKDNLIINNSAGMEETKWDHITKEILTHE